MLVTKKMNHVIIQSESLRQPALIKLSNERKVDKMLKKIAGVLLLVIGLFFAVSSLKMIFVDTPKMKSALKDAVYVGQGAINDANDGKIVIVCGPFELTTPSYDEELGLTIDSIRTSRSKQTMKLNKTTKATKANAETLTEEEKRNGVLEWSTAYRDKTLTGEGKIGNYTLSQDFIDAIVLNGTWHDYDRSELEASGYVWVTDANYSQKDFIEPLSQTQRNYKENDYRYFYDGANFKTSQTVTAIGIQDGDTLRAVAGITNNLMENELDRETAIAQGGVPGFGTSVFSIIFSLIPLLAGVVLLFTSGTRKP